MVTKQTLSHEEGRIQTLLSLGILDTPAAPAFDVISRLAARLMRTPMAQISFIDDHRQWLKSCASGPRGEVPRDKAFCGHTIQSSEPLIIEDALVDPRFAENPFVLGAPFVRFYAGVPLVVDGAAVGSLCIIDTHPRQTKNVELDDLKSLAELVVVQLYRHREQLELARSEERFRLAAVASSDAMYEWDLATDETVWAVGHGHSTGGGDIDLGATGGVWKSKIHPDDRKRVVGGIQSAIEGDGLEWTDEYRFQRVDGSYATVVDRCFVVRDALGVPVRAVGAMHNISAQKSAEARLHQAAYHDSLTGLPNRALFLQSMDEALRSGEETGSCVAIMYIDLDGFKEVNDTLGHDAGDAVLQEAARRLSRCVPSSGLVSRIGGDEFAVLLTENASRSSAEKIAQDLVAAVGEPVPFLGEELPSKASVGVSIYPHDDARSSELVKNADLALYRAKAAGGNQYAFFNGEMRQLVQQKMSALACAREALARDAIIPFYQPKASLLTGELFGFEALLRWTHPRGGIQPPGLIKEAFEDPSLSVEIGRRMLRKVTEDMCAWRASGIPFGSVAINVAAQQFHRTNFADEVLDQLSRCGLPTRLLEIEVTESVFLGDGSDGVGETLRKLHHSGVSISLDDFGTGYASLTHLNKFPISWIKIDQSFVRDMDSPDSAAIVNAVVGLAHNLGIRVVAEGVETARQWDQLKAQRPDLAQGYLIAKPMSGAHVPHFVKTWSDPERQNPSWPERDRKVG